MAVFSWYLVKNDLTSVSYWTRVHWTLSGQVTFLKVPEKNGHVYLVTLYLILLSLLPNNILSRGHLRKQLQVSYEAEERILPGGWFVKLDEEMGKPGKAVALY